jgi:D-psicose/D-tagatose/L-ribulose 3-epimerase
MKLGLHCYLFTDHWSNDCLNVLNTARSLGAECLEVVVGDDIEFTPRLTRQAATRLGLALTVGPGGLWPVECDISADEPADRAKGLAWHRKQIDLATEVGAVAYTGALYGHPGTVRRRVPPADEYPRTAEGLHRLAEHAANRGVTLAVEPMSHFRTHIANTSDEIMRLVALADHPNLAVLLDTYHMITEERDYGVAIRTVGDQLWGLHACENDRGVPGGGLVPWDQVFVALRDIAFDGYVMLEAYNSSLDDFAQRRGMFHNVCPDGEEFARTGLAFVRRGLGLI